ncbi:MAG: hypothetical protein J6I47_08735 [Ruminococcus sp.]|nr:hypothetical protein [Ruminococcus sp.]
MESNQANHAAPVRKRLACALNNADISLLNSLRIALQSFHAHKIYKTFSDILPYYRKKVNSLFSGQQLSLMLISG